MTRLVILILLCTGIFFVHSSHAAAPAPVAKSGQTTCWDAGGNIIACTGTGQDGDLQSGMAWPNPRFSDNGDQTMSDNLTGLVWSKNANAPGPAVCSPSTTKTWQGALDYVKCLNANNYLGYNDWSLPNRKELSSLVNLQQSSLATWLNDQGFDSVQANNYWSGNTNSYSTNGWYVNMNYGSVSYGNVGINNKTDNNCVWPVRSGQYQIVDPLVLFGSANFGITNVGGSTTTRQIIIGNRGATATTISTITIVGANASEFTVAPGGSNPCPSLTLTLASNGSCTVLVTAAHVTTVSKTAALSVSTGSVTGTLPITATVIATVYGTIVDQATNAPVSGATVTLNTGVTATTGANGYYDFGDLPAGTYSISVGKSGYQAVSKSSLSVTGSASAKADLLLPTTGVLNINTTTLFSATVSEAYSQRVLVTGGTAPYSFGVVSGTLPTGLTLDSSTGAISGTPSGTGSYTFNIRVTDSTVAFSERTFTIYLTPTLAISTASLPRGSNGVAYSQTIAATGGKTGYSYSVTSGILPAGLSLAGNGTLSGTPSATGTSIVTIIASDATGRSVNKQLALYVDTALAVSTTVLNTGLASNAYSHPLAATGGYGAKTWSITSGTLPSGLTLDSASGIISGTPTGIAVANLVLQVADSVGRTAIKALTLNVTTPLTLTTATLPAAYYSTPYSTTLVISGGVAPFTFSVSGSFPPGVTLNASSGVISGTTTVSGSNNVSITVTDSSYPAPQTSTVPYSLLTNYVVPGTCSPANGTILLTSPATNLCSTGTATSLSGSGPWTWECNGLNGGTPQSCSAQITTYSITAIAGSNGTLGGTTPSPAIVNYGSTTSFKFTADSGYYVSAVSGCGIEFSNNLPSLTTYTATTGAITGTCSVTVVFLVMDFSGPTLNVSALSDGSVTNNPTLNVTGTVSDISGVASVTVNGTPVTLTNGTFSQAVSLQADANVITVLATDMMGNQSINSRTITLDATAPTLTVTAPSDNSLTNNSNATVTGTVSETGTVQMRINNGSWQSAQLTGTGFTSPLTLTAGQNTIEVTATDTAGNSVATSAKRTVTYDNAAPNLAITNPDHDITTAQSSVLLSGTVSDSLSSATVSISHDSVNFTPQVTNGIFSQQLDFSTARMYPIVVTATDYANNSSTVTRNVIFSPFTVTFAAGNGGSISGTASQTVIEGSSPSPVTAVPGTGTHFVNWTGTNGFTATSSNPLIINNVTNNLTIIANFSATPVNSACGSSSGAQLATLPVMGLCAIGTPSAVTGTGPWGWSCTDSNGGAPVACLAYPTSAGQPVHTGIINTAGNKTAPDISDALAVHGHVAGTTVLTPVQLASADVAPLNNSGTPAGNGTVDLADVIMILRRSIGIGAW